MQSQENLEKGPKHICVVIYIFSIEELWNQRGPNGVYS